MDYEYFFDNTNKECNCYSRIRVAIAIVSLISLVFDCISQRRAKKQFDVLTAENASLKSIILKSVDNTFSKIMKNGFECSATHEE